MGNLLMFIIGAVVVFFAYNFNIFLGIAASIAFVLILIFARYTSICIALAMRNYTAGKKDAAFVWFKRAYKHGMSHEQMTNYGYYLTREGKLEEAEKVFTRMLSFNIPKKDRNYAKSNYAITLWKMGRIDEAIEELEEIFPYYKTTNVYGTLGYMYILKEEWEKAKAFNDEAYDYNNENHVILDNMTQLYYKLGLYEESEKFADEFLEKKPTFIEGFYDIAMAKEAVGKYEEALAAISEAEKITPTYMTTISQEQLAELKERIALEKEDGKKRFKEQKIELKELPKPEEKDQEEDDSLD